MKQTVIVSGFIVVILITALTILSVESKQDRKDELERVVAAAVKQTVKDSQIKEQKIIKSDKDMIANFVQNVCISLKAKGDISVKVMGVDYKEGLLDVFVLEKFEYLTGKNGTVSVRKCAIYE